MTMLMRADEEHENYNPNPPEAAAGEPAQAIQTAHRELLELLGQRAEVLKKIGALKRTIAGLACLFGEGVLPESLLAVIKPRTAGPQSGITGACRTVLMEAKRPLSAWEVCQRIQRRRPILLQSHKNAIASVTTVLNRLIKYGEALPTSSESGRRTWCWAASVHPQCCSEGTIPSKRLAQPSQDQ